MVVPCSLKILTRPSSIASMSTVDPLASGSADSMGARRPKTSYSIRCISIRGRDTSVDVVRTDLTEDVAVLGECSDVLGGFEEGGGLGRLSAPRLVIDLDFVTKRSVWQGASASSLFKSWASGFFSVKRCFRILCGLAISNLISRLCVNALTDDGSAVAALAVPK